MGDVSEETPVLKTAFTFTSADGATVIQARRWEPAVTDGAIPLRGIVQLVHGMVEYIDRYDAFARVLVELGYVVVGHDQLAHGGSVASEEGWGNLPMRGGKEILIADVESLRVLTQERYLLPHILFGFSMGSFVARAYAMRHMDSLTGLILCGTGNLPALTSCMGNKAARLIALLRGCDYRSTLLDGMAMGSYNKRFEPARTPYDWLTRDQAEVDAYAADPRCTFIFTVGGYATLTDLTGEVVRYGNVRKMPTTLPVLFISGTADPVGEFGVGVRRAYDLFKTAGMKDVEMILYEDARHELINETNREEVYRDVISWLSRVTGDPVTIRAMGDAGLDGGGSTAAEISGHDVRGGDV